MLGQPFIEDDFLKLLTPLFQVLGMLLGFLDFEVDKDETDSWVLLLVYGSENLKQS